MSDGKSIVVQVSGVEAQVCGVEEREELFLLDDAADLFPLLLVGIAACRVMRAGVDDDHGVRFGCLESR